MFYKADLAEAVQSLPRGSSALTGPPLLSLPLLLPSTHVLPSTLFAFVHLLPSTSNTCSRLCPSSMKPAVLLAPLFTPENLGASHLCLSSPLEHFPHRALLIGLCVFFHLLNGNHRVLLIFVFPAPSTVPGIEEVFNQYC